MAKAFPTAEGFGANSIGGRGGVVLFVDNLNDGGTGSFRAAVEDPRPRTIIFRVGGTITLNSRLRLINPYCTIAGQTAPGGGIQLKNYEWFVFQTHDIIIRYIRNRVGLDAVDLTTSLTSGRDTNAIAIWSGDGPRVKTYNIIVDHCTFMWSTDQQMDAYQWYQDVTYQWCHCGTGTLMGHSGNNRVAHCTGSHLGAQSVQVVNGNHDPLRVSVHHCLYSKNGDRMPLFQMYPGINNASLMGQLEWRNNIIYDRQGDGNGFNTGFMFYDAAGRTNYLNAIGSTKTLQIVAVGNHWRNGPISTGLSIGYTTFGCALYLANNINDAISTSPLDGFNVNMDIWEHYEGTTVSYTRFPNYNAANYTLATPFSVPNPVTTQPAQNIYDLVLDNVGPAKVVRNGVVTSIRDSVDANTVQEVRNRTGEQGEGIDWNDWVNLGQRLPYPVIAGGTYPTDSNNDGVPDSWALSHGFTIGQDLSTIFDSNGYTYLENYINELAGDTVSVPIPDTTPPAIPTSFTVS